MLATIISKYLRENRRLVIPRLGAFLVKEPGRIVLFSQLLTKDDGVLQNLLEQSGMSEVEASGAINRLLFDIRFVAENGGEYWLTGIGHFTKNENGSLQFEFAPQTTPQVIYSTQEQPQENKAPQEVVEPQQNEPQTLQDKIEEVEKVKKTEPEQEGSEPEEVKQEGSEPEETKQQEPTQQEKPIQAAPQPIKVKDKKAQADQNSSQDIQNNNAESPESLDAAPDEYRHIHFEPDPDLEGLSYGGKRSRRRASTSIKKLDWWMIVAITSAILALSVILYGYLREGAQHGSPIAARMEQSAK